MRPNFNVEHFKRSLTETILCCARYGIVDDVANSLRTPILRQQTQEWQFHLDELVLSATQWLSLLSNLIAQRERQLEVDGVSGTMEGKDLAAGRFLLFQPCASGHDGASQDASAGYFDYVDAPPWDTWVWFVEKEIVTEFWCDSDGGCLVSWVPSLFVDVAQKGIDVNTTNCIRWASEVDAPFTNFLRMTDLLV